MTEPAAEEARSAATADRLTETLGRFGLESFRSGQREVIETVLAGRDTLCVMPTGGGKSLCYQLPALLLDGVTVVVSPLIALMKDQEDQLRAKGIAAAALHSNLDQEEHDARIDAVTGGRTRLVYVAPERLKSRRFLDLMGRVGVKLLAIDEAHCISEWGHDFRPDYARLGWFRKTLGDPPVIALTATATKTVRDDIRKLLELREPAVFVRGFDRPNLHYAVTPAAGKGAKFHRLRQILEQQEDGSAIVYASSRRACEEVSEVVGGQLGRPIAVYHAGLDRDQRRRVQEDFMGGRVKTVVATNAFGMGIDKADIRSVVHYNLPGTLEAYYQEAGRAGRDGKPARCELLFSQSDCRIQEFFIDSEYPPPPLVGNVLHFLRDRAQQENPVELTRRDIAARVHGDASDTSIGACLKLLEEAGAVERLRPRQNLGMIRLDQAGPDLTDLLPTNATTQRAVLRAVAGFVGDRRGESLYFSPDGMAHGLQMSRAQLTGALGELAKRLKLEYIPPFRGNATFVRDFQTPFEQLDIDFAHQQELKSHEYEKLHRVVRFARTDRCRRQQVLGYFGEESDPCGHCDVCDAHGPGGGDGALPGAAEVPDGDTVFADEFLHFLRAGLDVAGHTRGRFGKTLVAQVLSGSGAKRIQQFGLDKLDNFGRWQFLRQNECVEVLEALLRQGLLRTAGETLRPTVELTDDGLAVINGGTPPYALQLSGNTLNKLRSTFGVRRLQASQTATVEAPGPERNVPAQVDPGKHPDNYWTWHLFAKGYTIEQTALIRHMSTAEVLDHAAELRDGNHPLPQPVQDRLDPPEEPRG